MKRECRVALEMALQFAVFTAADGAYLIGRTKKDPRYSNAQCAISRHAVEILDDLNQKAARGFEDENDLETFLSTLYTILTTLAATGISLTTLGLRRDYSIKRDK